MLLVVHSHFRWSRISWTYDLPARATCTAATVLGASHRPMPPLLLLLLLLLQLLLCCCCRCCCCFCRCCCCYCCCCAAAAAAAVAARRPRCCCCCCELPRSRDREYATLSGLIIPTVVYRKPCSSCSQPPTPFTSEDIAIWEDMRVAALRACSGVRHKGSAFGAPGYSAIVTAATAVVAGCEDVATQPLSLLICLTILQSMPASAPNPATLVAS